MTRHSRTLRFASYSSTQVAATIRRFETTGMTSFMKDDYVALHELEARIVAMRDKHVQALASLSSAGGQSPAAESE